MEEMNYIALSSDFNTQSDRNIVWMLETFIRSFAALGECTFTKFLQRINRTLTRYGLIDFNETSEIFQNTAAQVQQILAQVTPTDVIDDYNNLSVLFWTWLNSILQAYPGGCSCVVSHVHHDCNFS